MSDLPPVAFGRVVGRFLANIADGPDINDTPEFPPLTGTVRFTAGARKILVYEGEPDAATVVQLPEYYEASLDEFGYLTWRGGRGIKLVSPDANVNPTGWTWRADFDLYFEGNKVDLAPFSFEVPIYVPGPDPAHPDEGAEGLVDLTKVSPVPASNGEAVVRGLSVVDVDLVGDALVFVLDNGDHLDPVTVPQIAAATEAAESAATSASDAEAAQAAAQTAVNLFTLTVGTIETGAPGDPASLTVSGGPPHWVVDGVLPKGDTGDQGPAAPNATASTAGLVKLPGGVPGELGGTYDHPTVNGWDGKSDVGHTHTSAAITDATAIGVGVLTAGTQAAARSAIGAGTSNLALGTSGTTAAAGNDARLSDTRTPTAGTVPYDFAIIVCGKDTVRAVGTGDNPFGMKLQRAITIDSITVRGVTADASGNLVVETRKNGTAVSGANVTAAAATQVAGATATGPWAFAAGDVLLPAINAIGTTPGKGLIVEYKARV